ncbi:hypothetical protein SALWKB2_0061 [Snodgrassella alvi wkB2]|nr:hypothetical protein SALWKB2_0061 [Snodgrassella alvi wkB2]
MTNNQLNTKMVAPELSGTTMIKPAFKHQSLLNFSFSQQ